MEEYAMERLTIPQTIAEWNQSGKDFLPGYLGMEFLAVEPDEVVARMRVELHKCAWNGYLHAGAVVSLADTACGYATLRNLPDGASGFTTIELKSNCLGTTLEGDVICVAKPVHKGRTTQVWDAEVRAEKSGKTIAVFRCTQMILRPRS
jgi:1,4-dihydroxy-2-naphthoyl-CoA hydrolase